MILSSKVTWGLAWTGLAIILAVPSADYLTTQFGGGRSAAIVDPKSEPAAAPVVAPAKVETSAVTTIVTPKGVTITPAGGTPPVDPVDAYLNKNKALPDYLIDRKTEVAALPPADDVTSPAMAPVPFPRPVATVTRPVVTTPAKSAPVTTAIAVEPSSEQLVIEEPAQTATSDKLPPAPIVDDTATWRRQGLTQYLERNGLMDQNGTSTADATSDGQYDADGFYLSDGPNSDAATRRARVLELFGDDPTGPVPPASFNLF